MNSEDRERPEDRMDADPIDERYVDRDRLEQIGTKRFAERGLERTEAPRDERVTGRRQNDLNEEHDDDTNGVIVVDGDE